jgi:tight adherence protein B
MAADQNLITVVLMMLAAGGLFYVFAYPYLSGQRAAERRQAQFKQGKGAKRVNERQVDLNKRRQQIIESVRDIEGSGKKKQNSIESKIVQAGLSMEKQQFIMISVALGLGVGVFTYMANGNPIVALGGAIFGGVGLPRWILSFLIKRRLKKFLHEFPGAVDVIIRGVKAGLPIGQCLSIIAAESPEPVRSEFRRIVESQAIGLSVGEAVDRLAESMPLAEASFFSIVINLQQRSGGNLSEALGNLSRVLRDRKKMRLKISAMSAEAKASAGIIGALPFIVAGLVYLTSPDYMVLLFTTTGGRIVIAVSLFWMACGIFIMKKMISFDF